MTDHDDAVDAVDPPEPAANGTGGRAAEPDVEAEPSVEDPPVPAAAPSAGAAAEDDAPDEPPADFTAEQIDALVAERDDYLDQLQRTAAEFDNFRKQVQKRLVDEVARSQGSFVERLLPVLDAIEAAQAHGSTDIEAVATHLFGFLEKEGLQRVDPAGEVFDPNVSDAVVHEPGDGDEPIVTEVLRTGYLWQGRVIRPAMVKVAG